MRATIRSPTGQLSVLQLDLMPAWRFELMAVKDDIGIGFKYPMPPQFGTMLALGLRVNDCAAGLGPIAALGLSADSLEENQRRITSAFDTLYNLESAAPRQVDAAKARVSDLVKHAWDVRECLQNDEPASMRVEFDGWTLRLKP